MAVIAEFTVPATSFALQRTFEVVPDVTIEVERLATHSREWVMPFLWVTSDDIVAAENALRADPSVAEVQRIGHDGTVGEFEVEWDEDFQGLIDAIVNQHGILLEADAAAGTWYLKLKFTYQDAVGEFQTYFGEREYDFELQRIYRSTAPKEREYDLTPAQHEVLVTALDRGYFAIPRDAQIDDLADELGISTNAVSQRLRRATRNLTTNTLAVSDPDALPDDEARNTGDTT